jgi:hypothetical protein
MGNKEEIQTGEQVWRRHFDIGNFLGSRLRRVLGRWSRGGSGLGCGEEKREERIFAHVYVSVPRYSKTHD